ncbi:MAG: multiheme c-type cytochrome [bacterium JZ-2024 1]
MLLERLFGLFGAILLALMLYVTYAEVKPSWMRDQARMYRRAYERAKVAYESATDENQKKKYEKLMKAYRRPKLEMKQVLLQTGEAERCVTCHVDDDELSEKHRIVPDFPPEIYGCTVCHYGNPQATNKSDAHMHIWGDREALLRTAEQMRLRAIYAESPCEVCHQEKEQVIQAHPTSAGLDASIMYNCVSCHNHREDPRFQFLARHHLRLRVSVHTRRYVLEAIHNDTTKDYMTRWWQRMRALTPPTPDPLLTPPPTFREFSVSGERLAYMGSTVCLSCHQNLVKYRPETLEHVRSWQQSKFRTMEIVKKAPDFINPPKVTATGIKVTPEGYRELCYPCHTTGYNPRTKEYKDEGVTCEACHGPGQFFQQLMTLGLGTFLAEQGRKADIESGAEPRQVFPSVTYTDETGKDVTIEYGTFLSASGAAIARITEDRNVCLQCHTANYHEMRPRELESARLESRKRHLTLTLPPPG